MITTPLFSSWCEISCAHIERNLLLALSLLPDQTHFCAVLKADAYGHGIKNIVPILVRHGITCVGITSNVEAHAVRVAGFTGTIMRLRTATFDEIAEAIEYGVQEQISSVEAAHKLRALMQKQGVKIDFHLSLNAGGMSRDGLELSSSPEQLACREIIRLLSEHIVGICTHFPSNVPEELSASITRFHEDVDWVLRHSNLQRSQMLIHAGSTLTLVSKFDPHVDMMRCGAVLYGIVKPELGFKTTMTLKARVTGLGNFPKGSTIGYDRQAVLDQDKRLATVSLGYANGFLRQFAGRSQVLISGCRLPVLGKISMNTIVVDVSNLDDVVLGDEVVVFGEQGKGAITVQMAEEYSGTIMADLYTDWGQRNPRQISLRAHSALFAEPS
ncbi:alanine racemase [Pseudovibrio sp. Tun.PSC04-5.I4]|uniref:alanine racemase n=1 Tax=Pseudovibrio sp. Tun.PSC04-5.I4 TaxID=1798213 RepID=UPI00087EC9AC|nr:alanine racemase [Pseudovibrio sp. Tun.PSC04-5.I4]SDR40166.1 alanine racemase [Pseudovibrio sp. Tun.PSC04-5.I4]